LNEKNYLNALKCAVISYADK